MFPYSPVKKFPGNGSNKKAGNSGKSHKFLGLSGESRDFPEFPVPETNTSKERSREGEGRIGMRTDADAILVREHPPRDQSGNILVAVGQQERA
jgi:hypothetical protein